MREYLVKDIGCYLRYIDFPGEEIAVIYIHGNGSSGSFSMPEVPRMEGLEKHRGLVVDLLGCGYSDKPQNQPYTVRFHAKYLKQFLDDLGLKEFVIYGHSLGGAVAIELAALCDPNKMKGVIIAEGNMVPSSRNKASGTYILGSCSEEEFPKVYDSYVRGRKSSWEITCSTWLPQALHRIDADAVVGGNADWRGMFMGLKTKKYFVISERAGQVSKDNAEFFKENDVPVLFIENCGHAMSDENPVRLAQVINECLDDIKK